MSEQNGFLTEPEAVQLLIDAGISYPDYGFARSASQVLEVANKIGYPVVLKIVSPSIIHKSDAGGVLVNISNDLEAAHGYEEIIRRVNDYQNNTPIDGIFVCRQAKPGIEAIIGGMQDAMFGPALMFGLGGIFAEVFRDVTFRIIPIQQKDAEQMVHEIRGYPLLKGIRGKTGCDLDALFQLLLKVSDLMNAHPEIIELDLNPVMLYPDGVLCLDARIRKS
jgi:acyl-CoA synthetase (NDP forming)